MGMFSWNCKHCGHPLLCAVATSDENKWMTRSVALLKDGSMMVGDYDGYGNVADASIHECGEPEVYHYACWEKVGKPTEFTGESRNADDQGWFFDDGIHNSPPPGHPGFFNASDYEEPEERECPNCGHVDEGMGDWTCIECEEECEE